MRKSQLAIALTVILGLLSVSPARAVNYAIDPAHAGVTFKISHMGLSWTYGRFNTLSGGFTIDASDAAKSSFNLSIKTDSIDTGNAMRDGHLKSPDFLNVKQYPAISFKSTSVKQAKNGYEVTGDFTMHGVTKSITMTLVGGRKAEVKGVERTGFSADLRIKRSEYGITKFKDMIGDEVVISISFEGTKK